jgi:hypothetical protein
MNSLYTIVLDFRGGTYIAQISRSSPMKAVIDWSNEISEQDAQTWKLDVSQLRTFIQENRLITLDGLTNAWCMTGSIDRHLALINVIQTVSAPTSHPA